MSRAVGISLDCFRLLGPVDYHLEITCERAATPCKVALVGRVRGWCRGDLHAHTLHSDGPWDVPDLIAWAHQRKLDFVTLTGHNALAGHAELRSLANDDLLTMGGLELTTHWGHALSLGGGDWHEWRAGAATGKTAVSQSTDLRQVAARDDDAAAAVGKLVREMFDSASADLFKSIFHVKLQQGARMGFGHQGRKVL